MISSFPIPNAKEDIMEFMILASTNYNTVAKEENDKLAKAWLSKTEQAYQKAEILLKGDECFPRIESIYSSTQKEKAAKEKREIGEVVIKNIGAFIGVALLIAVCIMEQTSNYMYSSVLQLIGGILLVGSACALARKNITSLDYAICAASGLISIILSFLVHNGSLMILCGGITLIAVVVNFIKNVSQKK